MTILRPAVGALFALVSMPAALGACGADDSGSVDVNDCVRAGASYLFEASEREPLRSTACGAISDQVLVVPSSGELPLQDGCRLTSDESVGCGVRTVIECSQDGASTTITTAVNWLADGSGASGLQTFAISLASGSSCASTYDVIATQL